MVNITYRHYNEGDEKQLAHLFVDAFQMTGISRIDTESKWHWRYPSDPDFEPEMIQIAEDSENDRLVGMVIVNRVERVLFNSNEYLVGDVNDVSTDPRYTRQGIAKKLMEMAFSYMQSRDCDYSILTADPKGFPREKIYLKMGYEDVEHGYATIGFPYFLKFIKDNPLLSPALPIFVTLNYGGRFLNRLRIKLDSSFRNFSYEIVHNNRHWEVMDVINRILSKNYTGFYPYDRKIYRWMRINVPNKDYEPTYVLIKKNGVTIGGGTLTSSLLCLKKLKFKFGFSLLHEIYLDKSYFMNKRDLHFGYLYLIDKILKATVQRKEGVFIYLSTKSDVDLRRAFTSIGLLQHPMEVIMLKAMKSGLSIPKFEKPLYCPTYLSMGLP